MERFDGPSVDAQEDFVNSNLTTDTMIAANPTGTLQDDEPTMEMKLPTRAEIAAHLAQKGAVSCSKEDGAFESLRRRTAGTL